MSIFDRLLETDAEKLQEKEKTELKIKRLSDIVGEPFVVTCAALTEDQMYMFLKSAKREISGQIFFWKAAVSREEG